MKLVFDSMGDVVTRQLANAGLKFDVGETAAFSRQLESIQAEIYRIQYPDFTWRALLPIRSSIPLGARAHTYRMFEQFGEAEMLDNMGTEDFPTADSQGKEYTLAIKSLGAKYSYTVEDMRASQLMNVSLDAEKASAARRAIESKLDNLALLGAAGTPFTTGFANHPSLTTVTKGTQVSGTTWATATAPEIFGDFNSLVTTGFAGTKGLYGKYDVVLGTAGYAKIATTPFNQYSDTSIMTYLMQSNPFIRSISYSPRLNTAGAGAKERVLCYVRDPDVLEVRVPIDFEQFAPQLSGMAFVTHCHAKFGGVAIRQPKACLFMDGTQP